MSIDRQKLAKVVDEIPSFPESVHKVLELTSSPNCAPKSIVAVIEHDPVLTMKLLQMVNSAYFGLSKEVTSVKQAVVYVGINTVKNAAISAATRGALPKDNDAGLNTDELWLHSLKVGVIARLIAKQRGVPNNDLAEYFVAGLLHDIGKMIFASFVPKEYKQILEAAEHSESDLHQLEQQQLDVDHSEIGAMVAEKWKLPEELIRSIREHHDLSNAAEHSDLVHAIHYSNLIAHYLDTEEEERVEPTLPPSVEAWIGQSAEETLASLSDLHEEIEKAKTFIGN